MNETSPTAVNADPQGPWGPLEPGQEVTVRESGRQSGHGVIDNLTPDGSVVWVRIDGHAPRRMYLAGDAVEIAPKHA
ncbi:hypothetical protein HTS88_08655 [Pseudarthrobacter oxydans]|uniref:hypothetical protein n=1 Tax=Pseudarthrobacter oxydans TaxID=1671 RepID=UPI0015732050|nr:hypothetical protein [Pseudarthrobacter oxydans]MDZ4351646.1 hypothetical protein [Arthrobacter sp.]NSX36479.1 hypothetical protein [Pseudarthrobacter oxydans]